ncbi:MAG: hypothetical protein IT550_02680 [Novosphingobium sp.]|nr:hypothetical protein [Novosphingobium sp.]
MKSRVASAAPAPALPGTMASAIPGAVLGAILGAIALSCAVWSGPAGAVPGGELGTVEVGRYVCELAGDAAGPAGRHVPEADFSIVTTSSYRVDGRGGSYLRTGDRVVFTSGPRDGERYRRLRSGFLRRSLADGSDGPLRCVLANRRRG